MDSPLIEDRVGKWWWGGINLPHDYKGKVNGHTSFTYCLGHNLENSLGEICITTLSYQLQL